MSIKLMEPSGERDVEFKEIADRVEDLNGKTVGFLNNGKPNTDIFFERIRSMLSDEFDIVEN